MIHELKNILETALIKSKMGVKTALASVVALDGSSYRQPGVRMLVAEDGTVVGAVSGGCVEKEVVKNAHEVIVKNEPYLMEYDGRYRLGCEGTLYILIEPLHVSEELIMAFKRSIENRKSLKIHSYFSKKNQSELNSHSQIEIEDQSFHLRQNTGRKDYVDLEKFTETVKPFFRLHIIGAEHDAVKLCAMASLLGWEVSITCSERDPKSLSDFPGAYSVESTAPDFFNLASDPNAAVVIMTHGYSLDLKYLMKLLDVDFAYIGILGARQRRERLFDDLLNIVPERAETILDKIHSPVGLDIGAATPEEIALSILAEIMATINERDGQPLVNKQNRLQI